MNEGPSVPSLSPVASKSMDQTVDSWPSKLSQHILYSMENHNETLYSAILTNHRHLLCTS